MAPIKTQWTRLIRFVAAETSRVHIGEPVDRNLDVGLASHNGQTIKAYEIIGSALDPAAQVTENVLTVRTLLSPVSNEEVKYVRCLGLNYSDHAAEAGLAKPAFPILFIKPPSSLLGPDATITIPAVAQPPKEHLPDYEVEFTIVIGKPAKDVREEDALDYILGYTGANDVCDPPRCNLRSLNSILDPRFRSGSTRWPLLSGVSQKALVSTGLIPSPLVRRVLTPMDLRTADNTNPLGPCLVSASSIPDPQQVPLKCVLNGTTVQDGTTADMIFSVRRTIAFLSQGTTLEPGSLILTGTPKGVGFVKKPPLYLKDGDKVSTWVGGGIGSLYNDVKEERSGGKARL
ncbi:hypothetical protein AAF712_002642 [Marasmius tenuissimus]|uniref:Fumarylacetoacetase-like C-terminal domain-containing protein n=1 Tax=Marasmius tenuissimus TaxID=585030 RepID=A0ABR3AC61_9AGAR